MHGLLFQVVLVHGMGFPCTIFRSLALLLVEKGYRILTYDLFGRGYSDMPSANSCESLYVSQLASLTKKLNWAKFHLLGYSMVAVFFDIIRMFHD